MQLPNYFKKLKIIFSCTYLPKCWYNYKLFRGLFHRYFNICGSTENYDSYYLGKIERKIRLSKGTYNSQYKVINWHNIVQRILISCSTEVLSWKSFIISFIYEYWWSLQNTIVLITKATNNRWCELPCWNCAVTIQSNEVHVTCWEIEFRVQSMVYSFVSRFITVRGSKNGDSINNHRAIRRLLV